MTINYWLTVTYFILISITTNGQNILYKSNEISNITALVDGITNEESLVLNLKLAGTNNVCIFQGNKLVQCLGIEGSKIILQGVKEKSGLTHAFMTLKIDGKLQLGIISFDFKAPQNTSFKSLPIEGDLLFSFATNTGLHMLTLQKKKSTLELISVQDNTSSTSQIIGINDKELTGILSKNEFKFVDSTTTNFEQLSARSKAFYNRGKLILLYNVYEPPFTVAELKKIELDFESGHSSLTTYKLPFAPRSNHTSNLYQGNIYTLGVNSDYMALSVNDGESFRALTNLVYLKSSNKIDLKATPVYFNSGVPAADNNQWKKPKEDAIEELDLAEIIKKFKNETLVVKPYLEDSQLKILIGAYSANDAPGNWYGSRYSPGYTFSTPGGPVSSPGMVNSGGGYAKGTVDERRYFFGSINNLTWTVNSQETNPSFPLLENKLEKRLKEVFESDKVSEATLITQEKSGYVVYLLKKTGELVIEEIE